MYFIISKWLTFRNSKESSNFYISVSLLRCRNLASRVGGTGRLLSTRCPGWPAQRMTCPSVHGDAGSRGPALDVKEQPTPPLHTPLTCPLANSSGRSCSLASSPEDLSPPLCLLEDVLLSWHLWGSRNTGLGPHLRHPREPRLRGLSQGQHGPGAPQSPHCPLLAYKRLIHMAFPAPGTRSEA